MPGHAGLGYTDEADGAAESLQGPPITFESLNSKRNRHSQATQPPPGPKVIRRLQVEQFLCAGLRVHSWGQPLRLHG